MADTRLTVIDILEHVQKRPGMYFTPDTEPVINFLVGFDMALIATGNEIPEGTKDKMSEERGWKNSTVSLYKQMQERGMGEEKIIQEFLAIWIASHKRAKNVTEESSED